ncbi:MAG: ArsB/NhaD family transporter [Chloroflexi bacterium]|nr:ArsB/NhaD family transporter [Chloroflexota bacterium]MCI0772924.1 ArsB/NhaD family transporter [Chloroflexota bacterium]MCI0806659.1 ArsB/NhaD family transporter [Chloroflexota bacterium]MCI0826929.1 ArsB/NhaD family transporter [Chloroflexota bacterium]MCI0853696.1 ArsB/NhaD family transporter [Chloroflexota bacterium]
MLINISVVLLFAASFAGILAGKVHRAIFAMLGAVLMVLLGLVLDFYSQEQALRAIDFNTLGLLFGMMVMVAVLKNTGYFEYVAILIAKRTKGNPWILLVALGTITTVASLFLDNVTTVIIMAPVTILIAGILGISSIPLLMAEALLANTGGVATLVGDPPNILIGSAANLSFIDFVVNLGPIVLAAWFVTLVLIRLLFREELAQQPSNPEALQALDEHEALKDRTSANKVLILLAGVVVLFFLHSTLHIQAGLVALIGAAATLFWLQPDIEEVMEGIEWPILLFFAALFVIVGGVEASGLLDLVGGSLSDLSSEDVILMGVALIWVAAIASAVIDNIPFTIAMIPIIQAIARPGLDITPLWWALALGAGFGGNATPIGSTANIVVVTLSEKTKHPITTRIWLRNGLPISISTCVVATILYVVFFGILK